MTRKVQPSKFIRYNDRVEIIITNRQGIEKERAIVDLDDFVKIKDFRWHTTNKHYVRTSINNSRKRIFIYLHRLLLDVDDNTLVDHINQNPLDNCRKNLRVANLSINRLNSKLNINNTSGYRGVVYRKGVKKWEASIIVNGDKIYLAETKDKTKAIQKRLDAEKKYLVVA